MKKLFIPMVLLLALAGCGGSGGGSSDKGAADTGSISNSGSAEFPTQQIVVTVSNELNDPALTSTFSQEIAYAQQQFTNEIGPVYGCVVSVQAGQDTGGLTVHVQKRGPYTLPDGRAANGYYDLNHDAYVAVNDSNAATWPAYIDHQIENISLYPSRHVLIGQKYEAIDYNPIDHTQTLLNGFYWLCDWEKPDGSDFLGTAH